MQTMSTSRPAPLPLLAQRLPQNPLLTAASLPPSQPDLEVVSVFNAAAARLQGEFVLLLRVAEQPRSLLADRSKAMLLDLDGAGLRLLPMPASLAGSDLVGVAFLNMALSPPAVQVGYLPRSLPGLELGDPRLVRTPPTAVSPRPRDFLAQISHLRVARSRDGIHFTVDPLPALAPANAFEEYGCEDAHATLIDGVWHVTYVSVARTGITTSLATTTDFRTFERQGVIFLPDHKDVALFPAMVAGRYAALTRPMPLSFDHVLGIWIAFSPDLVHWGAHRPLALPRPGRWDEVRTGASTVPFLTPQGWLEIYHGVDRNDSYALGALLLDASDPTRVIGRSPSPILSPTAPYEQAGLFKNTVFSCGHVALDDASEQIRVYYGAADRCLCAADFSVAGIIDSLEPA